MDLPWSRYVGPKPPLSTSDYMLIWSRYYGLGPARIRWVGQWHKSDIRIHSLGKEQESHVSQKIMSKVFEECYTVVTYPQLTRNIGTIPRDTSKNSPSEIFNMRINPLLQVPLLTACSSL